MPPRDPPIAAILMARVIHGGDYTLAIVRTVGRNEGSAILERAGDAGGVDFVQYMTWRIQGSDDGPTVLSLERGEDSGDVEDLPGVLNGLLAAVAYVAGSWGVDEWERWEP